METEDIIVLIVSLVIIAVVFLFVCVWTVRLKKSYYFQHHSHEIIARVSADRFALYVDGNVEDEIMARQLRLCTLRAFVDGEELKVRVQIGWRVNISATAGGKELMLMKVEK